MYPAAVIIIAVSAFIADRRTLAKVDYSLLFTFAAIFIFVGNIARIEWIHSFISGWAQRNTLLTAIVSSQFISNVPAAVMLSGFTDDAEGLLIGVNAGGMGTLIASMASVISYKLYMAVFPNGARRYLAVFTVLNALSLGLSIVFIQL